jgi:uncharacterized protein YjbK
MAKFTLINEQSRLKTPLKSQMANWSILKELKMIQEKIALRLRCIKHVVIAITLKTPNYLAFI